MGKKATPARGARRLNLIKRTLARDVTKSDIVQRSATITRRPLKKSLGVWPPTCGDYLVTRTPGARGRTEVPAWRTNAQDSIFG